MCIIQNIGVLDMWSSRYGSIVCSSSGAVEQVLPLDLVTDAQGRWTYHYTSCWSIVLCSNSYMHGGEKHLSRSHFVATHFSPLTTGHPPCSACLSNVPLGCME